MPSSSRSLLARITLSATDSRLYALLCMLKLGAEKRGEGTTTSGGCGRAVSMRVQVRSGVNPMLHVYLRRARSPQEV